MAVRHDRSNEPLTPASPPVCLMTGWTALDTWMLIGGFGTLSVAVGFFTVLAGPKFPHDFYVGLIEGAVLVGSVFLFFESLASVRSVTLDSTGVTFRFLFHRERVAWGELRPGVESTKFGTWTVMRPLTLMGQESWRAYRITLEQARAVLAHPSCPGWRVGVQSLRGLGYPESSKHGAH